jgi:hypothetical protein
MRHVGFAFDALFACSDTFGRAVAALRAIWRGTVNLDQHRIVNIATERAFNGFQIGLMSVAGKLDAAANRPVDMMDKAGALPTSPQAQQQGAFGMERILAI